jgi:hypothetical protein
VRRAIIYKKCARHLNTASMSNSATLHDVFLGVHCRIVKGQRLFTTMQDVELPSSDRLTETSIKSSFPQGNMARRRGYLPALRLRPTGKTIENVECSINVPNDLQALNVQNVVQTLSLEISRKPISQMNRSRLYRHRLVWPKAPWQALTECQNINSNRDKSRCSLIR